MTYSDEELDLLREWREKCAGWRWLHYESMLHYKSLNSRYVYASILLSTVAGAGSFTTGGSGSSMGIDDKAMSLLIGGINVIISLLNSFQRFTKAAEKTELHASAAMQYAMIYRFIDTELQLSPKHQRRDLIQYVRQEFDRLLSQSPVVSHTIIKRYNRLFAHVEHKPDVCTGISTPSDTPNTPKRANINSLLESRSLELYNQTRRQSLQTADSCTQLDLESPSTTADTSYPDSNSGKDQQEPHRTS